MSFEINSTQSYKSNSPYTLAATTKNTYCGSIADTNVREALGNLPSDWTLLEGNTPKPRRQSWQNGDESNCFRSIQWTADGRYLVTNSEDSAVRVFGLPSEWSKSEIPHDPTSIPQLRPLSVIYEPESVYSIGACPWVLEDPYLNWFITCVRDCPIHLYDLTGNTLSTYILQHATTEKYLSPHCLAFSRQERHFICGTESMISVFDLNRREPLYNLRTIPSRKHTSTTQTMKGIISSLDIDPYSGILAAGTFTRCVGLYDQEGSGDIVSIFSLAEQGDNTSSSLKGVSDIKWSHCGTYLYVSERKDTKITVWDVRKLYAKVATLTGRDALTVQRLGVDIFLGEGGRELAVGGGINGKINLWDAHATTDPVASWEAHGDPVTSVAVNPAWSGLIASCSGQRNYSRSHAEGQNEEPHRIDNSLKLWKYAGHYKEVPVESETLSIGHDVATSTVSTIETGTCDHIGDRIEGL